MQSENETQEQEAARRISDRAAESKFVTQIVTDIAEPLARAFRALPQTGLVVTRYDLYSTTMHGLIDSGAFIRFMPHNVNLTALIDNVWRTAKVDA